MTSRHRPNDRILVEPVSGVAETGDQLYLLTLCLELQLDLLLVALRSEASAAGASLGTQHWPRWIGDTLDLTGDEPVVRSTLSNGEESRREWVVARYTALLDVINEMLDNAEVRRDPAVVARLVEARATCERRLTDLRVEEMVTAAAQRGPQIEPGHFLG